MSLIPLGPYPRYRPAPLRVIGGSRSEGKLPALPASKSPRVGAAMTDGIELRRFRVTGAAGAASSAVRTVATHYGEAKALAMARDAIWLELGVDAEEGLAVEFAVEDLGAARAHGDDLVDRTEF